METGASVPGYSGGFAACAVVSYLDFCSRGSLTPVAAPNVFLEVTGCVEADSEPCLEGCGLKGQLWKPGPAYPATVAAWPPAWWFRIWIYVGVGR